MEFRYRLNREPEDIIQRVCALAQDRLMVSGNSSKGWFTGTFEGTYAVDGRAASIKITRKTIFLSWSAATNPPRMHW